MARGLAISNIAWTEADDATVVSELRSMGVAGVEIAPTRRWARPSEATPGDIDEYAEFWRSRGTPVVACQALLYGRDDLRIFADAVAREATLEYLGVILRLGARAGARAFVFGSPVNRQVGDLDKASVDAIALPFFAAAGALADEAGVSLCLEPNPPQYKCDFLTTTEECVTFLEHAATPGLGIHLDAAALTLNGESIEEAVLLARPFLRHVHASEPYLAPIGSAGVEHARIAAALASIDYDGWISIEMRASPDRPAIDHVRHAVQRTQLDYRAVLEES